MKLAPMRPLFFLTLSFLALAAQVCNARPQVYEDVASFELNDDDLVPMDSLQNVLDNKATEVTVIDTLKDISKTLKDNFIVLGDKIKEKLNELKQAAGDQAQKIKKQLEDLKEQLQNSFRALKQKVHGFFKKGQYASSGDRAVETFEKAVEIGDGLNEFVKGLKDITADKLNKMQELAKQLRKEIKVKVQELLHGSSDSKTDLFDASDYDKNEEQDREAYVIATLKDISKSLREKFLILVEHFKQKFSELKQAGGENTEKIKEQLRVLKEKMADAREALKQKVQELFKPAQYASVGEHAWDIFAKLLKLREKLNEFLQHVSTVTGEKLQKLRELIKEARQEIKEKVQELIGSGDNRTALYHAGDDDDEKDDKEAYVIATLRDISKSLKEKFLILVEHLKQKFSELNQAGGEHAEKIKEQLRVLKEKLADAREALKQKVQELFKPAQYASVGEHAWDIFAKLLKLREKLSEFLRHVSTVTGEKLQKLRELIKEARQEIKEKVQELIGSGENRTALYHAGDDDDEEDDKEAYVIATLRDISKSLKEKFLILVEHFKQKFSELKQAGGEHAEKIKEQLRVLKEKMADARETLKQKVQELFKPAQYATVGEHASEIFAKLGKLREKLNEFLQHVKNVTGEKLEKFRELIKEARREIKEKVQELIGSRNNQTALYQAEDTDDDDEAYIMNTLKDISKTLKEKLQVLGDKIAQKFREIKEAVGQRAALLKEQLQELKGQLADVATALKKKVLEMVRPGQSAQYGILDNVPSAVPEKLSALQKKLNTFLDSVKNVVGEKWIKMRETIRELRKEIKQGIQDLLHGKKEANTNMTSESTLPMDLQY